MLGEAHRDAATALDIVRQGDHGFQLEPAAALLALLNVESRHELTLLDDAEEWLKNHDDFVGREPALAQLASAAVSGLLPAGPELRQPQPIALRGQPGVDITGPLSVTEMGFSLHAATTANPDDAPGREALVRYALRPPIAQERLHLLPDELVRIELKRPFSDGDAEEWLKNQTVAIDLDPLSLLCRLAASVPPPGFHLVHYSGVLGAAPQPPIMAGWATRRFVL